MPHRLKKQLIHDVSSKFSKIYLVLVLGRSKVFLAKVQTGSKSFGNILTNQRRKGAPQKRIESEESRVTFLAMFVYSVWPPRLLEAQGHSKYNDLLSLG